MTHVTIVGNLTADPELRFTPQGKAVANFTVAESQRVRDGNEWKDGPTTFWRCSIWDTPAENMAESLTKGQRVIVTGEAKQRSFETREGEKRSVIEVTATEVGPSLKWATATPQKTAAKTPGFNAEPSNSHSGSNDPWAASTAIGDADVPF